MTILLGSDQVDVVAELTEEITRRLEPGEPLNGDDLGDNPACAALSASSCPRCEPCCPWASRSPAKRALEPA